MRPRVGSAGDQGRQAPARGARGALMTGLLPQKKETKNRLLLLLRLLRLWCEVPCWLDLTCLPDVLHRVLDHGVIPVWNTEPQSVLSLTSRFAFVVAVPGALAWRRARVAHLGRLRRGHRFGRLRWEDRMASYSEAEACLGLPWRTAALDRLLWQDEATRYAVHGLALSAGWRRLYSVWAPHVGP